MPCIGYNDNGQPQGLSLRMVGNGYFRKFVPLARQRFVEVAAPYKYASISNHKICIVNNIRPYCICFICCFEQNKTNPSVYASRIRLPYRGAKIDSATNLNLSIRFMYARRYINVFYHDIIHRKNFPPPCSKISNSRVLYFARFV